MSIIEIQNALKNMSGEELDGLQNAIVLVSDAYPAESALLMRQISRETRIRQSEGWDRKAARFWNRHGEKIGMLAIGALIGDWVGD
ncbi:MAG: hypothetical protein ABII12_09425 [Planctomycetota bacterium]